VAWGWFVFAGLFVLLLGAYLALGSQPVLRWALEQARGAGLNVNARDLGGNLLSGVTAREATVQSDFVNGTARAVTVRYDLWTLLTRREVRLNVDLQGGNINFDPGRLPQAQAGAAGGAPPVTISLQSVRLEDTQVKVFNRVFGSPDVRVTVLEQRVQPGDSPRGTLKLALNSADGAGTAEVRYSIGKDFAVNLTANADLDARIARFWYKDIRSGRVRGTVNITPRFVTAQARVENGVLEPLPGLVVRDVSGRANFGADERVSALLTGSALGGTVEADIGVDVRGERWSVIGRADPTVAAALERFAPEVAGTGRAAVTVRGGGWEQLDLRGTVTASENSSVAGFPVRNLQANWRYTDRLEVDATGVSAFLGESVNVAAKLTAQGERVRVSATGRGNLLQSPLSVQAGIDVLNGVTRINGTADVLRGEARANLRLEGENIGGDARFDGARLPVPFDSLLSGTARVTGTTRDLRVAGRLEQGVLRVPGVRDTAYPGAFNLRWNGAALSAQTSLGAGRVEASGVVTNADGSPARGIVNLRGINFEPGGVVDGALAYQLNANGSGSLEGNAAGRNLEVQGFRLEDARGPLALRWNGSEVNARWDTDRALLTLTERAVRVQPRDWRLTYGGERLALTGDLGLEFAGARFSGTVTGRGGLGEISLTGRGRTLEVGGTVRYEALRLGLDGSVALEPLAVRVTARPQSTLAGAELGGQLEVNFDQQLRVSGTVLTSNRSAQIQYVGSRLQGSGEVNLSALDAALPASSRGLLRGVARLEGSSALVDGVLAGIPARARVTLEGARVAVDGQITGGDFAGAQVRGTVLPDLEARARWNGLNAQVTGSFEDVRFTANGAFPRFAALEANGVSLSGQAVSARGRFANGRLEASGTVGNLRVLEGVYRDGAYSARLEGSGRLAYQGRPIRLEGVRGTVSGTGDAVRVNATANAVAGGYANTAARVALEGRGSNVAVQLTTRGGAATGTFSARDAAVDGRYDGEPLRARGLDLTGTLNGDALRVNFTARALEGGASGARGRVEAATGRVSSGGNVTSVALTAPRGTATYSGERLALQGVDTALNLRGSRLEVALNTRFGGQVRGEALSGRAQASLGLETDNPNARWDGNLEASAQGNGWRVNASGPWTRVRVDARAPSATLARLVNVTLPENLRTAVVAQGFVSLPEATYTVQVSSALGAGDNRLGLQANVNGSGAQWRATGEVRDAVGGAGSFSYDHTERGALRAQSLRLTALTNAATTVSGALEVRGVRLNGSLEGAVADLPFRARWTPDGAFSGQVDGPVPLQFEAARWDFPLTVAPIQVHSRTGSLPLEVAGALRLTPEVRFDGSVTTTSAGLEVPGGRVALEPRSYSVAFSAADGVRARLEGADGAVVFDGNAWRGGLSLPYRAWDEAGTLAVTVAGELGNPTLNVETRGRLNLIGSASLEEVNLTGSLGLEGFTRALEPGLRERVTPGRLGFTVRGAPSALAVQAQLNGASVDGEAAKLQLEGTLGAALPATGSLALGGSSTQFALEPDGLRADAVDLDLRLLRVFGIDAQGQVLGALELPQFDLGRANGTLELTGVQAFGASLEGRVTAARGAVGADLNGFAADGVPVALNGALYPNADASVALDGLRGRVTGSNLERRERTVNLELNGTLQGKASSLSVNLTNTVLRVGGNWDALRVTASGRWLEDGVRLNGSLGANDLRGVAGVAGNVSAQFAVEGSRASLTNLRGNVAGYAVAGAATFENGVLEANDVTVNGADLTARASGRVFPTLEVGANVTSRNAFAPGTFTARATGSVGDPVVTVSGTLEAAQQGLIAPGTGVSARLEDNAWTVRLEGAAVRGTAQGTLERINQVNLELNAPVQVADTRLRLNGPIGWTAISGFSGDLNATGTLLGSEATARLQGQGALEARLSWRSGVLRATLPARVDERVDAALTLERLDLGALWGKPDQLRATGSGRVAGVWTNPSASFSGNLEGGNGTLNARLEAAYTDGNVNASLRGERVNLTARLEDGAYSAQGTLRGVRLEALLPVEAKSLEASGAFALEGGLNARQGLRLEVTGLDIRGDLEPIGAFDATGTLTLNRTLLAAQVSANVLGGTLRATGRIGERDGNVNLNLQDLNLEPLGVRGRGSAALTLRGAPSDPTVAGTVSLENVGLPDGDWSANARLTVAERLLNPVIAGTATLNGRASGQVQLRVREALSPAPNVALSGAVTLPEGTASGDLEGAFPNLRGALNLSVNALPVALRAVTLSADGAGGYALQNRAARGTVKLEAGATLLETRVAGNLQTDLALEDVIGGALGRVGGSLEVAGTLAQPRARFAGALRGTALSGIAVPDTTLTATLENGALTARGEYPGGAITVNDNRVALTGLTVRSGGNALTLGATGSLAPLDLTFTGALSGVATGTLNGRYAGDTVDARLEGKLAGLEVGGAAQGSVAQGWSGALTVRGLPAAGVLGTLPAPAQGAGTLALQIVGPFDAPTLEGNAQILGSRLEMTGALQPLRLTVSGTRASGETNGFAGTVNLNGNALGGALEYAEGALRVRAEASGSLEQPVVNASAAYGRTNATARATLQDGTPRVALTVGDGTRTGNFTYTDGRLQGAAENLDLSSLEAAGYGGSLSVRGDLRVDAAAPLGVRGAFETVWQGVVTPLEVPLLGWRVDGTGRATLDTERGAVALEYRGSPGTARGNLTLQNGLWTGEVNADLRGTGGRGSVKGDLRLGANGINGNVSADSLPLEVYGVNLTLNGTATASGETFTASGVAQTLGGQITVTGNGGLSDLVPALEPYTRTAPGDLGYALRARLDTVKLEDIAQVRAAAPGLTGRAIGVVQITDGASSFQISVPELGLPDLNSNPRERVRLGLRITGTAVGTALRYNGRLVGLSSSERAAGQPFDLDAYGESTFSGSLNGSVASGLLEMRRAPLHSLIGAVFGALPGRATATGVARYEIPLNDLAKSEVRTALEKLEIEGGGDRLSGFAALNFKNGNLTLEGLDLRGRGRWTGGGRYTREGVDLRLDFENTSFTPVLALIPTLRDYNPDATGTVRLKLSGRYALPDADLEVQGFSGRISGIALRAQTLTGSLRNGDLRLNGAISSDETLGATLETTATARVTSVIPTNITNLEARLQGSLNLRPVGLIEDVNARVYGESGGFKLQATGRKGGALEVAGDLSPVLNVRLTGRNLIVPIPEYFVSDSLLDADLALRGDGARSYALSGNVNLQRLNAAFTQSSRPAGATAAPLTPTPPVATGPNPLLEQIKLIGVRVTAPQGLRVNESFAALEAGGMLTLTGTAGTPEASGALEALGNSGGRGTIRLGVNSYSIQSAVATFNPVEGIFPVVNIQAVGQVRAQLRRTGSSAAPAGSASSASPTVETAAQTITVNLQLEIRWINDARGARQLEITPRLSAEPVAGFEPLSESELYSLVTLGSSSFVTSDALRGIGQQALDTAFGYFFLAEFSRQFRAATGVDLAISTNLFDYIFNPDQALDENLRNTLNFTFNFGIDLSNAVRLNLELGTSGTGAINLNYQSDDGRFGIRFNTPFDLNATPNANTIFGGLQPELSFSYNISSLNAFTLGLQYRGNNNFSIRLGFSFRF
jgi:hypothetical protein